MQLLLQSYRWESIYRNQLRLLQDLCSWYRFVYYSRDTLLNPSILKAYFRLRKLTLMHPLVRDQWLGFEWCYLWGFCTNGPQLPLSLRPSWGSFRLTLASLPGVGFLYKSSEREYHESRNDCYLSLRDKLSLTLVLSAVLSGIRPEHPWNVENGGFTSHHLICQGLNSVSSCWLSYEYDCVQIEQPNIPLVKRVSQCMRLPQLRSLEGEGLDVLVIISACGAVSMF